MKGYYSKRSKSCESTQLTGCSESTKPKTNYHFNNTKTVKLSKWNNPNWKLCQIHQLRLKSTFYLYLIKLNLMLTIATDLTITTVPIKFDKRQLDMY